MKMTAENKRPLFPARCVACAFILCFFVAAFPAFPQTDSASINKKRLNTFLIASGVGYGAGLVTLNHVWYRNTDRQSFRFFNDNAEWKQMDKAGHVFTSYHVSHVTSRMLRSSGVAEGKADLYGALSGFLLTVPIEIFDGFSDGYGASAGDVVADAVGPAIFLAQRLAWDEVRIHPKFSFQRTDYAPLRPALLGDDLLSEVVKDYNGQTYWLSLDIDKFTPFPKWLNLAIGYGAGEMIYARDSENEVRGFRPHRQYYLAVDFDLSGVKTRSKVVKTLLYVVNMVHLPAPALEFSSKRTKFHSFYF